MKLEDQVLSIEQIKELQELGFDIVKYASMEYAPIYNNEYEIVNYYLRVRGTGGSTLIIYPHKEEEVYIPTLTIGDIISVLPIKIEESYFLSVTSEYCGYSMVGGFDTVFFIREKELINNLFKTLIWCIKNKHIAL